MKQEQRTITFTCDICRAENITPVSVLWKQTFGYRPVEPYGVTIEVRAFGDYCEHVCRVCATKAFEAAKEQR